MTKDKLIETIQRILDADDVDLDFLLQLKKNEIKTLVVCIRDRVEHADQ